MHRLWPLPFMFSLAGCPASTSSGLDGQAGTDGATSFSFASADDVALGFNTIELPYLIAFSFTPEASTPSACPVITMTPTGWTARGGCTDAMGTAYAGDVRVTKAMVANGASYVLDYHGFEGVAATWSIHLDGQVRAQILASSCGFPGPAPLDTDGLRAVVAGEAYQGFGGYFPGVGRSVSLTFHGYHYAWDLNCNPAKLVARGTVEIDGRGSFAIDMSRADDTACRKEGASGTATLTGESSATIHFDGAQACDGCLPFDTSGGLSGQLCRT